jgi:hypothetical protein
LSLDCSNARARAAAEEKSARCWYEMGQFRRSTRSDALSMSGVPRSLPNLGNAAKRRSGPIATQRTTANDGLFDHLIGTHASSVRGLSSPSAFAVRDYAERVAYLAMTNGLSRASTDRVKMLMTIRRVVTL